MSSSVVEETTGDVTVEDYAQYNGRLKGRTRKQKETEAQIRSDERDHWTAVFTRLGDGRANRSTPAEVRAVYRQVAAMIGQNRDK